MRKMDLEVSDGSEGKITDRKNWVSKQKWPESDVSSAEEFEPWTTSPPPTHGNDEDNDEDDDDFEEDE